MTQRTVPASALTRARPATKHRHMRAPPPHPYGWFAPLRAHEVRVGAPTSFEFMGQSLVAFRDRDGVVRVLDATCPHFGAHLGHGGEVRDGCIRCPYHKLDFDGDGRCVGAAAHYDPARVGHLRARVRASQERYGLVWVWHGRDPATPDRPIALDALDWEGWTDPITNDGLCVANLSPLWLAENIADLAHLRTVHCWDLDRVVAPPGADADGTFRVAVDVRWRLGARSRDPRVQQLGRLVNSPFHLDVRAHDAGIVVAHAKLTEEQGSIALRNVVLVCPLGDGSARLRVLVSVRRQWTGVASRALRFVTGRGFEELLAPVFLAIGVSDFNSDARVWERRKHLDNPVPLQGEGAFLEFRRWSLRFWPDDHEPDAREPDAREPDAPPTSDCGGSQSPTP